MPRTFLQLTPDLWTVQSQFFYTNSGIFLRNGQACLIDPCMLPAEIEEIARFVEAQGAAPQVIILTHSHWDHILGPERFPGVKTIAQAEYLPLVRQYGHLIGRELALWETPNHVQRAQPFQIPIPDETFDDRMTLAVGDLALHLLHAPGHAPDQLVVYQPDTATLWAADTLSDVEIPFASHSLVAYQSTLARLATLDIRVLVPGHGHPTTDPSEIQSRLAEDTTYLAEIRHTVEQALHEGKTLVETVAQCSGIVYRHPEENAIPHRLNVESAYAELGGPVDSRQVGWYHAWMVALGEAGSSESQAA